VDEVTVPRAVLFRGVAAVVTVFLVVSIAFGVVATTNDPNEGKVRFATAVSSANMPPDERVEYIDEQMAAFREARSLDRPLHERYVTWLGDFVTLDWGRSYTSGQPVTAVLLYRLKFTVGYLVPGFTVGALLGIGIGAAAAIRGGYLERITMGTASFGFALPAFLLAVLALTFVGPTFGYSPDGYQAAQFPPGVHPLSGAYFRHAMLPIAIVALGVATGMVRHAHNQTSKLLGQRFVTALRAKGGTDMTVGRHTLRHSLPVLGSLVVTDFLSTLVLTVYVVEYVFKLPGFGALTLDAVLNRDLPLLLGATFVVVVVGVTLGVATDVVRAVADPR
jgi:peptide/nickel transport system permease protein